MSTPAVQVAKLTSVYIQFPYSMGSESGYTSLDLLGYTRNYAEVTKEAYWVDVPGDQFGGDEGPPIEVIYLGETARIRLELTKWDPTVLSHVAARVDKTPMKTTGAYAFSGSGSLVGRMMFSTRSYMRVVLSCNNTAMNRSFPRCIPREPIELNRGTKYSTCILEFQAYPNGDGVVYESQVTTTSGTTW